MVHMANQIAIYFASYPPRAEAIAGVADYLKKYWERRMRRQIMQYVALAVRVCMSRCPTRSCG
jgi:formate dehydrogenase subunit delta